MYNFHIHRNALPVRYGVPQGSILGPLLGIIYMMNDIPEVENFATFILHADDTNISITTDTIDEVIGKLQELITYLPKVGCLAITELFLWSQ